MKNLVPKDVIHEIVGKNVRPEFCTTNAHWQLAAYHKKTGIAALMSGHVRGFPSVILVEVKRGLYITDGSYKLLGPKLKRRIADFALKHDLE